MSHPLYLKQTVQVVCICVMVAAPAAAATAGGAVDAPHAGLPGGDGQEFRNRMTNWAAQPVAATSRLRAEIVAAARVPMFISSGFGRRADPIKDGVRMHDGIDLPGRLGTRVHATGSGVVSFAGWAHGYGNLVQIDHPGHLTTRYGHLSRILVARGTPVVQGAVIGEMGSTGRSTGSHLHYEVRADGVPLNPLQFVGAPSVTYEMTWAPQARVAPRWTGWGGAGDAGSLPVAEIR